MSWTKEQISLLIEEYAKFPCLFAMKSRDHNNKHKRNLALQYIAERLRPLKEDINAADIQKKFLGLRTTFACERKKVFASMHSGMDEDDVYMPSLWYYEKMTFLIDQYEIRPSKSLYEPNLETNAIYAQNDSKHPEGFSLKGEYKYVPDKLPSPVTDDTSQSSRISNVSQGASPNIKRRMTIQNEVEPEMIMLEEVPKNSGKISGLVQIQSTTEKTSEDVFGEFVAMQLKKINNESNKMDAQFEIHGILLNALKKNNESKNMQSMVQSWYQLYMENLFAYKLKTSLCIYQNALMH